MSGISRDDWLNAVAAVTTVPTDTDALTLQEFAQLLGCSRYAAVTRMRALVTAGKARQTRKVVQRSDGCRTPVPAYVLIQETPDDGRKAHRVERRAGRDRHAAARRS